MSCGEMTNIMLIISYENEAGAMQLGWLDVKSAFKCVNQMFSCKWLILNS
jgi:hypothetical protein